VRERQLARWKRYIRSSGKSKRSIEGESAEKRQTSRKQEMEVEIRTDLPAKIKRERKHSVISAPHELGASHDGAAAEPLKIEVPEKTSASESLEVEVLRIPPNPRLVICRCVVGGSQCKVWVGRNANFVPRMRFKVRMPAPERAKYDPWKYEGPLPRRRGRW
jgi:hypothetical protein